MLFQSRRAKLFAAIREGREDRLRELLDSRDADLSEPEDGTGQLPLVLAVEEGRLAMVKALLAAGAPVDSKGAGGRTALIAAASAGNGALLEILLAAGAAVDLSDREGRTALHAAVIWATRMASLGVSDTEKKIVLLLEAGASINHPDRMGRTPLMSSVRSGGGAIEEENRMPVLRLLLERGAEVNAVSQRGRTALMSAAFRGLKETAELLVEAGSGVNTRDNHGRTALMYLAQGSFWSYRRAGYIGLLSYLLDHGADPSLMDSSHLTALALARRHRHENLVEILEKYGVRD